MLIGEDADRTERTPALLIPDDIFELFGDRVVEAVSDVLDSAEALWGPAKHVRAAPLALEAVLKAFQALQGREIWRHDGDFIERYRPTFGPGVKERFVFAKHIHDKDLRAEEDVCKRAVDHLRALLAGSGVLILPTLPGAGLKRDCTAEEMNRFRSRMSASFCLGGLAGVPWVTLPLAEIDGAPLGVSLVSGFGTDAWLLEQAGRLFECVSRR